MVRVRVVVRVIVLEIAIVTVKTIERVIATKIMLIILIIMKYGFILRDIFSYIILYSLLINLWIHYRCTYDMWICNYLSRNLHYTVTFAEKRLFC